ncbi:MAG: HAMP domain-containing sensor histidine kinase [Rhodospirillaceae bacterium]
MSTTISDSLAESHNSEEHGDPLVGEAMLFLESAEFGGEAARAQFRRLVQAYRDGLNRESQLAADAESVRGELLATRNGLVHAEQLASLGGLVAGVAHEVSTPVGIVLTAASHLAEHSETLRRIVASGRIKRSDFDDYIATALEASGLILSNSRRAAELIQGFKQVAVDQTTAERRRFNLKHYIQEVLISLSPRLRQAGHRVVIDCPDDLEIDSFPGAFAQIITNLVMNSVSHGYERGQNGRLTIAVRVIGEDLIELHYADDGRGIPVENRARIFDPYFTTRRGDGGTGLGLYIVSTILAKTLHGSIYLVESDKGAEFSIRLPRRPGSAARSVTA